MALYGRATYVQVGRMAAMILAPSLPKQFDARLRDVNALISLIAVAMPISPIGFPGLFFCF